jgi:hypothetical protein
MITFTLRIKYRYTNMIIFFLTPLLGSVKNYVKYKRFHPLLFLRSPLLYFLLQIIIQTDNIWMIMILERWIMFVFKIIRSLWRNDYQIKKEKYKLKYNLKYN